jgi:hypothetical protein
MPLSLVLRPLSSVSGRLLLIAVITASALAVLGGSFAAEAPQDVQRAAEQANRRLDLQTELPRERETPRYTLQLPAEVLWVVVAIAVGVLLYGLRDLIPIWRFGHGGPWTAEDVGPNGIKGRPAAAVLRASDELAAEGRLADAMHVLLLQALADIRQGLDEQFADSLTSREILRSTRLSEAGRASLRDIVDRVEWTYFGERPATLPDYVACRASFDALAQALPRGAAA